MARIPPDELTQRPPHSPQARGKFGKGNPELEIGNSRVGKINIGEHPPEAKIWRVRHGHVEEMKYYHPSNPRTQQQQIWRAKFAMAVRTWQQLPPEQREAIRELHQLQKHQMPMSDYNFFISLYLTDKLQ